MYRMLANNDCTRNLDITAQQGTTINFMCSMPFSQPGTVTEKSTEFFQAACDNFQRKQMQGCRADYLLQVLMAMARAGCTFLFNVDKIRRSGPKQGAETRMPTEPSFIHPLYLSLVSWNDMIDSWIPQNEEHYSHRNNQGVPVLPQMT
eukprot:1061255-Pelagomonas_calceolata.AAC.1